MAAAPPSRWHAEGRDGALVAAEAAAREASGPPPGWTLARDRATRVVLRATLPGPDGPTAVAARVREAPVPWNGARAHVEGAVLRALEARGVAVPHVLGWSTSPDGRLDLLLLRDVEGGRELAAWARGEPARRERLRVAEAVGRLLRRAHDAGWRDRDVHRKNLLVTPTDVVLADAGTTPPSGTPTAPRRVEALAAAAHGLRADPRAGLRALRAYFDGDREAARRFFPLVARAERAVRRAYRRGRAMRAARSGRQVETFEPFGPGSRGVRARQRTPAAWSGFARVLVSGAIPSARPLKAGGQVLAARLPGLDEEVVVKRYAATWRDRVRLPRALRAFRRAYALRVRGVPCPEPLIAAAEASGEGAYVAATAGPPGAVVLDLACATRRGEDGRNPLDGLPAVERRRALLRLGRFLRRLHDADVTHRDLKAANLVAWWTGRETGFAVVDLDGARARDLPVPWRRRARDLARLDASVATDMVSRTDRRRVLAGYYGSFERPGMPVEKFARVIARRSAWKRGPTGVAR